MKLTIPDYIQAIEPYVPGKPMEALEREYGIRDSVKLASNENPLGPSPKALDAIRQSLTALHRYPDGAGHRLTRRIAEINGIPPQCVVIGNGSDDIIALLIRALIRPGDGVIVPWPSFLMYTISANAAGAAVTSVPLKNMAMDLDEIAARIDGDTRLVFICNPNNPTGTVVSQADFERFLDRLPDHVVVVVDAKYVLKFMDALARKYPNATREFGWQYVFPSRARCAHPRTGEIVRHHVHPDCLRTGRAEDLARPLVTLRTFSKAYGLAGLRVGYGIMPAMLAEVLHRVRPPFNVNAVAQAGALAALDDREFLAQSLDLVHRGLDQLYAGLDRLGLTYHPTEANFFLIDVGRPADAVFEMMLRQGVIVRSMKAYGFSETIRINAGREVENQRFLDALETVLGT